MKIKFIFSVIFMLILLVAQMSCKKYLDKKSDTSLVTPNTLDDLQGVLDDFVTMNQQTPSFGEASSDDYFLPLTTYNAQSLQHQEAYIWKLGIYNYPNDWASSYKPVYNANYCLEVVELISKTTKNKNQWNNVKGSALFFRAYYFLNLAWTFCKAYNDNTAAEDLGIVLRLASDFNLKSTRSTLRDSYEQIISDLQAANELLPDNPLHIARPSKAASYALLARTYLSMRKYDSAFKYSNLSLQIKNDLLDYNSTDINPGSTTPFPPFNPEIIFYTTMSNSFSIKSPGTALIDSTLYDQFMPNDVRRTVFFRNSGLYKRFKGSYAASPTTLFSGIAVDEVLLIRAECNTRLGRPVEAINELNSLLVKRWETGSFTPIIVNNESEVLEIILMERRKELMMRGIRWSDIKRLNKEEKEIIPKRMVDMDIFSLEPNEKRYALPLPKDILDLTGMQQN